MQIATPSLRLWCLLIKIRVQLQLGKVLIGHRTELCKGTVGQLPQFRFLRRKLAAHLTQAVDQAGAAAGILNAHQVHFLKSKVSHIKSPFPHSFWVPSFCVLLWAGFSADPQRIFSFPVPPDERRQPSPSGKWADRFEPAVPALPP